MLPTTSIGGHLRLSTFDSVQPTRTRGSALMIKTLNALAFLLLSCGEAHALDGFETIRCGSNIPAALMGKRMSNERFVIIEARHKNLRLKDLGGEEVSDRLNSVSWLICGNEFILLENTRGIVRDVLPFPSHSKKVIAHPTRLESHAARTSGAPWRVRRMASMARMQRRLPVSMTDRTSA